MEREFLEQKEIENAIDELENINESVNLEAINNLHRIARESENLRQSVFDTLCSYIRTTTSDQDYQTRERPSIKIQSILNLLVADKTQRFIYEEMPADLHESHLPRAILSGADLKRAASAWQPM